MPRLGGTGTVPSNSNKNNSGSNANAKRRRGWIQSYYHKYVARHIPDTIVTATTSSTRNYNKILPKFNLRNAVLLVLMIFVFKNIFFQDYKSMEIKELKNRGYTEEQIARLVPNAYNEDAQDNLKQDEIRNIKVDVAYLMRAVADLRTSVRGEGGNTNNNAAALTDDAFRTVDIIHMEKRREREKTLSQEELKQHVDFNENRVRRRDKAETSAQIRRREQEMIMMLSDEKKKNDEAKE